MENDIFSNNNVVNSDNTIDNSTSLVSTYDFYDYREVIEKQNTIIENQNKVFNLINEGFTFLSFIIIIYFLYLFIKNMIRK